MKIIEEQCKDSWSNIKLQTINLIAEEARYHERCHNKFFLKNKFKKSRQETPKGHTRNYAMFDNFSKLCKWLEREGELYSLTELHDTMTEGTTGTEPYTRRWTNKKVNLGPLDWEPSNLTTTFQKLMGLVLSLDFKPLKQNVCGSDLQVPSGYWGKDYFAIKRRRSTTY